MDGQWTVVGFKQLDTEPFTVHVKAASADEAEVSVEPEHPDWTVTHVFRGTIEPE